MIAIFAPLLISLLMMQTSPLNEYRWSNRIVLINSDNPELVQEQESKFRETNAAFKDRDLILISIVRNTVYLNQKIAANINSLALRDYFDLPEEQFRVLLIGKDGGVKLSDTKPIDEQRVYNLIDSMPMRKAEMRRKGSH